MGEINIPREERDALKAIDVDILDKRIEQCLDEKRFSALRGLGLESCGPYVASNLRKYETALAEYSTAKAAKKLGETKSRARRAGDDLARAVQQMKYRVGTEETEDQLFHVEDRIIPPYQFSEHLTVCVSYRWRPTTANEWVFGSITFTHDVDTQPDHTVPPSKRKPSAAQQARNRQDVLYREWEHLMRLALHSVKEYFRDGGNAAAIPKTFKAKADAYSRGLNNFSTRFWLAPSSVAG